MDAEQIPPRVSALIVSRNCAPVLRQCLTALETTSPLEILEILVVDNGSRDESARLDAEFPEVHYLRLPKNFGLVKALNIGIRTAKGDYVFLLPAHILVQPGTIASLLELLESDPTVGAVCPYVERSWPLPDSAALKRFWKTGQMPGASAVSRDAGPVRVEFPMGAPLLIRRGFLSGMNYFDERFGSFGAELELYWRLHDAGKNVLVHPDVSVEALQAGAPEPTAAHSADIATGAAAFLAKHQGAGAWVGFRAGAFASVLGELLTLRAPVYNLKRLGYVLAGQKIDGTQE